MPQILNKYTLNLGLRPNLVGFGVRGCDRSGLKDLILDYAIKKD